MCRTCPMSSSDDGLALLLAEEGMVEAVASGVGAAEPADAAGGRDDGWGQPGDHLVAVVATQHSGASRVAVVPGVPASEEADEREYLERQVVGMALVPCPLVTRDEQPIRMADVTGLEAGHFANPFWGCLYQAALDTFYQWRVDVNVVTVDWPLRRLVMDPRWGSWTVQVALAWKRELERQALPPEVHMRPMAERLWQLWRREHVLGKAPKGVFVA